MVVIVNITLLWQLLLLLQDARGRGQKYNESGEGPSFPARMLTLTSDLGNQLKP